MDDDAFPSGAVMLDVVASDDTVSPPQNPAGRAERLQLVLRRVPQRLRVVPAVEWVGLVTCLAPVIVACVRAFSSDWRPVYDSAYFTTRSYDVLTSHHPFVGAWSTFGAILQESIHNVGPLQLLALAPFTRVHPYIGTAVGVGFVNAVAVVTVWFTARRLFDRRGVITVMAATAVLMMSFGASAFVDARQQHALLLPFWAILWLTTDLIRGTDRALIPWLVSASFALQTHLSYAYLVLAIVIAGVGGYGWSSRGRVRTLSFKWHVGGGVVLAALLWAHTAWDQFFGDGNLGTVMG